jgi:WD40 repeat protein
MTFMKNDASILLSFVRFYRFLLIVHVVAIGHWIHAQEDAGDRNEVSANHSVTHRQWMIPEDRLYFVGQATSTLAWHPEGKLVAFSQASNPTGNQMVQELMLVDIETAERMKVATLPADTALNALVWDSSGRILILSGSMNGSFASFAWDIVSAKPIWNIADEQVIGSGADGQLITASTVNRDVKIRHGATGEQLAIVKEAGVRFNQRKFCIASDGARLQCFDYETNTIFSWNLQDGSALPDVQIAGHRDARPPATAAFSLSGNILITGGWDHTVRAWNSHSGAEECVFRGHTESVISVACSASGEIITSRSRDSMRSWNRSARKQIAALENKNALEGVSTNQINDTMSPAGNYVAAFGEGVFRLFGIQTMQEPGVLWFPKKQDSASFLSWAKDSRRIAGLISENIDQWDISTGVMLPSIRISSSQITSQADASYSPNGNFLFHYKDQDGPFVLELDSGKRHSASFSLPWAWHPVQNSIGCIVRKENDCFLLTTDFSPIRHKTLCRLQIRADDERWGRYLEQFGMVWSKSGDFVATWPHRSHNKENNSVSDNIVIVWDSTTGRVVKELVAEGHEIIRNVSISPNGQLLAASMDSAEINGSFRESMKIWDLETGSALELPETDGTMHSVAFSPDGQTLATSGDNIRLWNVDQGGIKLSKVLGHVLPTDSNLSFSPDGRYLAASDSGSSYAKGIELWRMASNRNDRAQAMSSIAQTNITVSNKALIKGEIKSESLTPSKVPISRNDLRAGIGFYYVDDTKLFFSDGQSAQLIAAERGLTILGNGKSGLIFRAGDPEQFFSVMHDSKEITEITDVIAVGERPQGIGQVIPASSGYLAILTSPHGYLYWTDGTKNTIRNLGGKFRRFDSMELVNDNTIIFERVTTKLKSHTKYHMLDSTGQLKTYYEESRNLGEIIDSGTFPVYASPRQLFTTSDHNAGRGKNQLMASPNLQPIYDSGKGKMWEWNIVSSTISPYIDDSSGIDGIMVGDTLYFPGFGFREGSGDEGIDSIGLEVYMSDGTFKGTRLAYDFDKRKTLTEGATSRPRQLTPLGNNGLVLLANDTGPDNSTPWLPSIWSLSGSNAIRLVSGTEPISFSHQPTENYRLKGRSQRQFLSVGTRVYYFLQSPIGLELWQTDGTVDGTVRLTETQGRVGGVFPMGTSFVFSVIDNRSNAKLWICDGTLNGTVPVGNDVIPTTADFFPIDMAK